MLATKRMEVKKIDFSKYKNLTHSEIERLQKNNDEFIKNPKTHYVLMDYSQLYFLIYHTLRMGLKINSIKEIENLTLEELFLGLHYLGEKHRIESINLQDGK